MDRGAFSTPPLAGRSQGASRDPWRVAAGRPLGWGRARERPVESAELDELDVAVENSDAPPGRAPAPAPLGSGDTVPLFRSDLRVARGASPALFEVSDPASGRSFTLYEFELALARMLDGRRKASELVASGGRLGVPVDLPGLDKFVRQLWHYGFLAPSGPDAPAQNGAAQGSAREEWDEATRTLYETGLRLVRAGRAADAASYFEAMLDAHPACVEATEMLALVAKGRPLEPSFPAGAREAPPRRGRWLALAAGVSLAAIAAGAAVTLRLRSAPAPKPEAASPAEPPPAPAAAPAPPPSWRSTPVLTRRHPPLGEILSPGSGTVRWRRAHGASVREGEQVGELRIHTGTAPRPDLARRVAELEKLAAQDPVYRDFLEKARREARRGGRGRARAIPLRAPAAGELSLVPEASARAEEGAVLARVVAPAVWQLGLTIAGEPPPPNARCEVVGDAPSERAPCRLAPGAGGEALAELSAADAPWLARAQSPFVRFAPEGATAP